MEETIEGTTKTTAPLSVPKAAIPPDPFPHKRHYEGGFIFNMPVQYYAERTEPEIKQSLVDAGHSKEQVEIDMGIIREGLAFHEADFKKPEEPKRT